MLTGRMVRVRHARERLIPYYLDVEKESWLDVAERLLELFGAQEGKTRGEIEADLEEEFGEDPGQLVQQGLVKLLEDRCEFEVDSGTPPEELREHVFRAAARHRAEAPAAAPVKHAFDRDAVLRVVADELKLAVADIDRGLFADLRTEQRLVKFKALSPQHLLQLYNVSLAQAVLLRAIRVHVDVRNESPARYRQILRRVKFHRLICEVQRTGPDSYRFHLDGPLSLFSATQKYGLQLALFLPAVLPCRDFELRADLRWGVEKKPKLFQLTPSDGLTWPFADHGMYTPPELRMFVELFAKRQPEWFLEEETDLFPLGDSFWVPDFRLRHKATGKVLRLEVLGFWRKASAEKHLERLRKHVHEPFLLAVSDQLHIGDAELEGLPAGVVRFRQMPLPDEVARLAREL